jgi:hypothetical protein
MISRPWPLPRVVRFLKLVLLAIPTVVTVVFTLLAGAMLLGGSVDRASVFLLVALLSLSVAVSIAAFEASEGKRRKRGCIPR